MDGSTENCLGVWKPADAVFFCVLDGIMYFKSKAKDKVTKVPANPSASVNSTVSRILL